MPFAVFLKRSLTLRLVLAYGGILLASLLLATTLVFTRVGSLVDETVDAYGNTVSSQLANAVVEAVMQNDRIALQAHLARLLKTPGIVSAAIYDIEHRLLAQGGATPSELAGRHYLHNYTATLAFGDNALGVAVVTLDASRLERVVPQTRQILLAGLLVALFLVLLLSRHFAHNMQQQRETLAQALADALPADLIPVDQLPRDKVLNESELREVLRSLRDHVAQLQTPSPAALRQAAADLLNSSGGRAYLLLECRNFDLLQRQVSRERLRRLLDCAQEQVEKTCRLYSAQRVPVAGSGIKMVIAASTGEIAEALLKAAFMAQVLSGVLASVCRDEELGIQLQWTLALDWHPPCDNDILRNRQQARDDQRSLWLCRQVAAGELAVSAEAGALLQEQDKLTLAVDHGEDGKPFYRVSGIVNTQRVLLEGQIAQLLDN